MSAIGAAGAQAGTAGQNLQNLMGMAGTAERAGNNEEAITYYNRVLEADPSFSQAWLGKGRAAGWLSSLVNVRISETLVAFGHAIATAGDDQELVTAQASTDLTTVCHGIYKMARRHFEEHNGVDNARTIYVSVTSTLIDAIDEALRWQPNNRQALDLMVLMCRQLLDFGLTPESADRIGAKLNGANERIEALDPEYKRPKLAERTQAQEEKYKAEMDNIGYIVLFIVVVLGAIITAASRH